MVTPAKSQLSLGYLYRRYWLNVHPRHAYRLKALYLGDNRLLESFGAPPSPRHPLPLVVFGAEQVFYESAEDLFLMLIESAASDGRVLLSEHEEGFAELIRTICSPSRDALTVAWSMYFNPTADRIGDQLGCPYEVVGNHSPQIIDNTMPSIDFRRGLPPLAIHKWFRPEYGRDKGSAEKLQLVTFERSRKLQRGPFTFTNTYQSLCVAVRGRDDPLLRAGTVPAVHSLYDPKTRITDTPQLKLWRILYPKDHLEGILVPAEKCTVQDIALYFHPRLGGLCRFAVNHLSLPAALWSNPIQEHILESAGLVERHSAAEPSANHWWPALAALEGTRV